MVQVVPSGEALRLGEMMPPVEHPTLEGVRYYFWFGLCNTSFTYLFWWLFLQAHGGNALPLDFALTSVTLACGTCGIYHNHNMYSHTCPLHLAPVCVLAVLAGTLFPGGSYQVSPWPPWGGLVSRTPHGACPRPVPG